MYVCETGMKRKTWKEVLNPKPEVHRDRFLREDRPDYAFLGKGTPNQDLTRVQTLPTTNSLSHIHYSLSPSLKLPGGGCG